MDDIFSMVAVLWNILDWWRRKKWQDFGHPKPRPPSPPKHLFIYLFCSALLWLAVYEGDTFSQLVHKLVTSHSLSRTCTIEGELKYWGESIEVWEGRGHSNVYWYGHLQGSDEEGNISQSSSHSSSTMRGTSRDDLSPVLSYQTSIHYGPCSS